MGWQRRYDNLCQLGWQELLLAAEQVGAHEKGAPFGGDKADLAQLIIAKEAHDMADPSSPLPRQQDDRRGAAFAATMRAMFPSDEAHGPYSEHSDTALWIVEEGIPNWIIRFLEKNADYGNQHATIGLGPRAEFVGLWRKIYKLRESLWREKPMLNEDTDEMLQDIIGTCFLILHLRAIENGDAAVPES